MENRLLQAKATLPQYDRGSLQARIVHLGFGAFPRAHQAVYADILAAEHGSDWGYTVSVPSSRRPNTPLAVLAYSSPRSRFT